MDTTKYLPIGSIVTIEDYEIEVMIMGYMIYAEKNNKNVSGDYVGVPIEEGYKKDNTILFNKDHIKNVIFMGYKNQSTKKKLDAMDKALDFLKRTKPEDDVFQELFVNTINSATNSKITRLSESTVLKEEKDE